MVERLGEASLEGQGAAFDAITKLGLDLEKIEKLNTREQFLEIADALSKVDSSTRNFLATEIGQDEFFKLAEFMNLGREEMEAMLKQAALVNGELSDLDIQNIRQMEASAGEAQAAFNSIFRTIAADVAPVMSELFSIASDLFVLFRQEGLPVLKSFGSEVFETFLGFAQDVLPSVITGAAAMFDHFQALFAGIKSFGESAFNGIAEIFSSTGQSIVGDGNWIDDITVLLSTVAAEWPNIFKSTFLSIGVIITDVFAAIENKVMSTIENVQRAGLKAAAFGKLISQEELQAGLAGIDEEQRIRQEGGSFFGNISNNLEESLNEVNEKILKELDRNIQINKKSREAVQSQIDRIRKSLLPSSEGVEGVGDGDGDGGGAGDQLEVAIKQADMGKLISASEAGTKQSVDLLNSRALKGQDVNKGILGENKKQTTLLEKMLRDKGLSLPVAQGI